MADADADAGATRRILAGGQRLSRLLKTGLPVEGEGDLKGVGPAEALEAPDALVMRTSGARVPVRVRAFRERSNQPTMRVMGTCLGELSCLPVRYPACAVGVKPPIGPYDSAPDRKISAER